MRKEKENSRALRRWVAQHVLQLVKELDITQGISVVETPPVLFDWRRHQLLAAHDIV